jgi:hypothetical protein
MKTITVAVLCLAIFIAGNCQANELNRGQIIHSIDQKVKIVIGDKALTNLGMKAGVIKGDILTIYKTYDTNYIYPIGKCAVTDVYDVTSICEIIKINNTEISYDTVVIDRLKSNDFGLYPVIFQLLTKVVEPYEPHKDITVYVHSIFDEQDNITKFSESVQKEIKKIFYQKKRIKQPRNVSKSLFAYQPGDYAEYGQAIEGFLNKDNNDVLIGGRYRVKGDKIELTLYKMDRNWEDIVIETTLAASSYAQQTSSVVTPYKPIKKERNLFSDIVYKPVSYKANIRDERNNIIAIESKNDPFLEYSLKRIDFNIISPVDFKLIVDNNEINFEKAKEQQISMTTGKHEITAVFKKGFYLNDSLLLTTDNDVKKDIVLILDNPGDIKIEVTANPVPGRENIDFKIYKKADISRPDFKQVPLQRNNIRTVETFKD